MSMYSKSKVENAHFMSLRGKRDFRLTWQSRGSAIANKVAFQRIATAKQKRLCFAMT